MKLIARVFFLLLCVSMIRVIYGAAQGTYTLQSFCRLFPILTLIFRPFFGPLPKSGTQLKASLLAAS